MAVEANLTAAWLNAALREAAAGAPPGAADAEICGLLTGRLSRSGNDIVVRCRVLARVGTPCVRCLDPALVSVQADLSLLLQPVLRSELRLGPARAGWAPEHEFSVAEADLDVYDGETVVLDDFVREAILLEIPNFPLCSPSCPGIAATGTCIAPQPAPAPALDPRFAALGALRDAAREDCSSPRPAAPAPRARRKKAMLRSTARPVRRKR